MFRPHEFQRKWYKCAVALLGLPVRHTASSVPGRWFRSIVHRSWQTLGISTASSVARECLSCTAIPGRVVQSFIAPPPRNAYPRLRGTDFSVLAPVQGCDEFKSIGSSEL